jgi:hypothetical protein
LEDEMMRQVQVMAEIKGVDTMLGTAKPPPYRQPGGVEWAYAGQGFRRDHEMSFVDSSRAVNGIGHRKPMAFPAGMSAEQVSCKMWGE